MASVGRIKVVRGEVGFCPVADVEAFFLVGLEHWPERVPVFALSFFGGLRSSQIRRLERSDFRFQDRGILMPAATHKTSKRFYVEGFEDNLWAWLEPWHKKSAIPRLPLRTMTAWRRHIYTAAGINYPHNGGRHSFCTYHVAKYNDASKTATLLTHRGVNQLYNDYRGNATGAEAKAYFEIRP